MDDEFDRCFEHLKLAYARFCDVKPGDGVDEAKRAYEAVDAAMRNLARRYPLCTARRVVLGDDA